MSHQNTFITVAPDCPVEQAKVPVSKKVKKPIHLIQYELLQDNPYQFTHQELVFTVYLIKEGIECASDDEKADVWNKLFSKGHPCLRASALTKKYGFGAHYDQDGKIALYPMEGERYQTFITDDSIKKLAAMRSKR